MAPLGPDPRQPAPATRAGPEQNPKPKPKPDRNSSPARSGSRLCYLLTNNMLVQQVELAAKTKCIPRAQIMIAFASGWRPVPIRAPESGRCWRSGRPTGSSASVAVALGLCGLADLAAARAAAAPVAVRAAHTESSEEHQLCAPITGNRLLPPPPPPPPLALISAGRY